MKRLIICIAVISAFAMLLTAHQKFGKKVTNYKRGEKNLITNHSVKIYLSEENTNKIEYMQYLKNKSNANSYKYRKSFDDIVNNVISENLTERQRQIIELHMQGLKNKEIALKLNLAQCTVSRHLQKGKERIYAVVKYFYR